MAKTWWDVLWRAYRGYVDDDCPTLAAGLAFYTVFSFAPLLVIVLYLAGIALDSDVAAAWVEREAHALIGAAGAAQVGTILGGERSGQASLGSWLSGGAVILGAMTVLVQVQRALNRVWQVRRVRHLDLGAFVVTRITSLAIMAIAAVLLVVSVVVSAVLASASSRLGDTSSNLLDFGVSVAVFSALFTAAFKYLPDRRLRWADVGPGGLLTGVLFVVGKMLLGRFLGATAVTSLYGAAGSLAVVLVWAYYTAMLFLFGAEVGRAWSTRSESVVCVTPRCSYGIGAERSATPPAPEDRCSSYSPSRSSPVT